MPKPEQFFDWPAELTPPYAYRAVADRVVDGDTLYAFIDLGLNHYAYESIRLSGVEAPELFSGTDRQAGAQAKDKLVALLPTGTKMLMWTEKDRASFGRYIATLYTDAIDGQPSTTLSINQQMIDWLENRQHLAVDTL